MSTTSAIPSCSDSVSCSQSPYARTFAYGLLLYLTTLPFFIWFTCQWEHGTGVARAFYLITTMFTQPAAMLMPAFVVLALGAKWWATHPWGSNVATVCVVCWAFLIHLLLLTDVTLLHKFGFHINGMVINLITTRGGFESMGLDTNTLLPATIFLLVLAFLHITLALCYRKAKHFGRFAGMVAGNKTFPICCAIFIACTTASLYLTTGIADFYLKDDVMCAVDAFPIGMKLRMRKFMKRIGLKPPKRQHALLHHKLKIKGKLNYPLHKITRMPQSKKMNIIWIVCESLRADMMTAEIMPKSFAFSKNAHRFANHYSGGHGTRPAIFSLFYGLYGMNWDTFLKRKHGPVFIDWILQDQYQILCQTSAHFTYPEFDRTIFAAIPQEELQEIGKFISWKRDVILTDNLLAFIDGRDKTKPFFTFGFFEATHAPYNFPKEAVIRKDYMEKINYAAVSAKNARQLRNRSINAAHFLDGQFGRIIDRVQNDPELKDNTIFVFTGDHGEEFYEKGRLGHNSTFVEEQIRVPLILSIPGTGSAVHTKMSNHIDVVPTIAPFLGVENPPQDYCLGQNLLNQEYRKDHFVVCGWDTGVMVTEEYKVTLPLGDYASLFNQNITTRDDRPVNDEEEAIEKITPQLLQVLKEVNRFTSLAK